MEPFDKKRYHSICRSVIVVNSPSDVSIKLAA